MKCRKSICPILTAFLVVVLMVAAPAYAGKGCKNKSGEPGYFEETIWSGGMEREYVLYVHPRYKSNRLTPLVFLFHGFGQTAEDILWYSDMMAFADAFKFILVAPRGFMFSWNDGSGFSPAGMSGIDDVIFVADMIEEVSQEYCVHSKRIFATGISNGAAMSYHLACQLSELIAAVGPVAGPDTSAVLGYECPASRPVSVIGFNGTADIFVPWSGGPGFWPGVEYPPVPVWIDEVAARNGCSEETEVVYQKGDVTCIAYENCEDGATVTHCSIDGGGHNWPGAVDLCALFPEYCSWAGYTTDDIDASRAIWKFFAEHAKCDDDCECDED